MELDREEGWKSRSRFVPGRGGKKVPKAEKEGI